MAGAAGSELFSAGNDLDRGGESRLDVWADPVEAVVYVGASGDGEWRKQSVMEWPAMRSGEKIGKAGLGCSNFGNRRELP